jgi:hypothetical protein
MSLGDHVNLQLKRGVKIITCDPQKRLIEAETRNGEVISVNSYHYSPMFRWPVSGEKWMVGEENGSWYLEGIYETQEPKEELTPAERAAKEKASKEKAEREEAIRKAKAFECGIHYLEGTVVKFNGTTYRKTNND